MAEGELRNIGPKISSVAPRGKTHPTARKVVPNATCCGAAVLGGLAGPE